MRGFLRRAVAGALIVLSGTSANAQSDGDTAAWFALMGTTYGALPVLVSPAMAGLSIVEVRNGTLVEARYGRWAFDGGEQTWNNFGIGRRGEHFGFAFGYGKCEGCEDAVMMGGLDYEWALTELWIDGRPPSRSAFVISLRPAAGFAVSTQEGTSSAASFALDVPVSYPISVGAASRIVPFVAPGFGYGRFTDDDTRVALGGTRPALSAGIAFISPGGLGVHFSWRKIFIEDGASSFGIGLVYGG